MRLSALCAGIATAVFAVASAQSACLKADAPDQVAEGRLVSVRISIPDYKLKEQAYICGLRRMRVLKAAANSTRSSAPGGFMCSRWTTPCANGCGHS